MSKIPSKSSRRAFLATSATLVAASGISAFPLATNGSESPPVVKPKDSSVSLFVSTMSNIGIEPMRHALSHDIKPLVPVGETVLGSAITTKWEVGRGETTSGVIVIPKSDLHRVIEAANVLLTKEEKVRSKIESGAALADAHQL